MHAWTTRAVNVGEVTLALDEWPGEGPRVLFMHATGFSRGVWRPIADRLTGRCRPISLDLRGHGGSSKPAPPYDWESITADVLRLIELERWSDLIICGHSLGGAIAVDIAVQRPDLVRSLVLVEAPLADPEAGRRRSSGVADMEDRALRRRHQWPDRQAAFEHLRARVPYSSWDDKVFEGFVDTAIEDTADGVQLACTPEIEASLFAAARASSGTWARIGQIECPVWLGRGTGDRGLQSTTSPDAASRIPNVIERVAKGDGHFVPLERVEWVVQMVDEALGAG